MTHLRIPWEFLQLVKVPMLFYSLYEQLKPNTSLDSSKISVADYLAMALTPEQQAKIVWYCVNYAL